MPRLLIFYHFFHPDDVVSARLYRDFAEEQRCRGWEVTVLTSNRLWQDPSAILPAEENWHGIDIRRQFRPSWPQSRAIARLGNSIFLLTTWALRSREAAGFDAIVVGSDPAFAALLAIPLRAIGGDVPILHWCFDMYPEAIEAGSGGSGLTKGLAWIARRLMAAAYRRCDVLVDIGPAMRARLADYASGTRQETLTPWALAESGEPPPNDAIPFVRTALFGDARLGLLYAGTMGRAHDFDGILRLARACRARSGRTISFCFACRGNRTADLRAALGPKDDNIRVLPFASESDLAGRLSAADLHLVSLRPEWSGIVVPSKFFASLAMGRPVIYSGPRDSEIAQWIERFDVGMNICEAESFDGVVERLHMLVEGPSNLLDWQQRSRRVYFDHFSRKIVNERWSYLLHEMVRTRDTARHSKA